MSVPGERSESEALGAARQLIDKARFADAEATLKPLRDAPAECRGRDEALYITAVAQRYQQRFESALETLNELIAVRPDYGRAWQELGHTYRAIREGANAAHAYARAVELNPGLLSGWKALAALQREAGRAPQAAYAAAQIRYLESLPKELAAVVDLTHEGKLGKADALCRAWLRSHKHDVEGIRLLADIAVRLGIYDDAEFLLESCLELAPDNTRARADYAVVLNRKAKFEQALTQANRLCEQEAGNPAFQLTRAAALAGVGHTEEAIEVFESCLPETQNKPGVYVSLGHAYKTLGKLDEAIAAYRQAYAVRPDYGDAYWSLANTKTYRFTDQELEQVARQAGAAHVGSDDRTHLCFAAGKAYEDRGDYPASFAFYERGNALRKARSGYDPDRTSRLVDAQIDVCTTGLFERRVGVGCRSDDPIFIVGLPRAGSTLLEQILASHSMVDGTAELHDILALAQRLSGRGLPDDPAYPAILATIGDDYFCRFGEQYMERTRVYRRQAPYFIDKMPNNFLHIGLIRLILPNAKVIDARREPMACCFSGFKQLFGEGQDFTYDLEWAGRYYADYLRMMDHWDRVLPGFVLRVKHEDVVDDLQGQVTRILEFCGLPYDEACLRFHETKRSIRTPSSEQVRQPIYRSGLDQWRNFESFLGPLSEALRKIPGDRSSPD